MKKPTKRAQATAERKRAILEAAVMCFIETGYHQTGMRDIAKRAGVSLGNLYNHFAGKTDILAEIAAIERDELTPFLEILAQVAPARDVLAEFATTYTQHLSAPETIILTLELTSEAIRHAGIADLFMDSRGMLVDALTDLLQRGVDDGTLRASKSATETAFLLLQMMEGAAFRHGIEGVPIEAVVDNQLEFIQAALATE